MPPKCKREAEPHNGTTINQLFRKQQEKKQMRSNASSTSCKDVTVIELSDDDDFEPIPIVSPYFNLLPSKTRKRTSSKEKKQLSLKLSGVSKKQSQCKLENFDNLATCSKSAIERDRNSVEEVCKVKSSGSCDTELLKSVSQTNIEHRGDILTENSTDIIYETVQECLHHQVSSAKFSTENAPPSKKLCKDQKEFDMLIASDNLMNQTCMSASNVDSHISTKFEVSSPVESQCSAASATMSNDAISSSFDTNISEEDLQEQEGTAQEYAVPYYLENFELMLSHVLQEDFYSDLFSDEDRSVINNYYSLSEESKKLYVRLFGRNHRWLVKAKIVYPKIAHDLTLFLQELSDVNLLENEDSMHDASEVLTSLPANGLKTLAKSLLINPNQPMKALKSALLEHGNKPGIASFFKTSSGSDPRTINKILLKRAKQQLGSCFRLETVSRSVFLRVFMLFGLHNTRGEDEHDAVGQTLLFQMLMSNLGRIKYPDYELYRTQRIFKDREALIKYGEALQVEVSMVTVLEKKLYEDAYNIYLTTSQTFKELVDSEQARFDSQLPEFLRSFTAGAVYGRVMNLGVEACQFLKKYAEASTLLEYLLSQTLYNSNYRGRWYDRLALNLDYHMKTPEEALNVIEKALQDVYVRKGHRYSLFLRAQKICKTSSFKLKRRWKEFAEDEMASVQEPPKMVVTGRTINHGLPGTPNVYIKEQNTEVDDFTILKRVEDVVLNYCSLNGFPEGLHAEGSIFSFFLGLLMWDVIYAREIPDVFYNRFQTFPLDFYHRDFFSSRKDLITHRIEEIRTADEVTLLKWLEKAYEERKDTFCIGVNWELFRDVEHAKGLLSCIGSENLATILDRMIKDPRFTRGGVPDLVVWNPDLKSFKVIEVKGPGDRLSTKQTLWIDYMVKHGIDASVCYVQAVGSRKL